MWSSAFGNAGAMQLNEAAMQQLQQQGYDRELILESLMAGDCNAATAAYHLMQQALMMKQDPTYSSTQPQSHMQRPGDQSRPQSSAGAYAKRIDTPMRMMARSYSAQPGIQAYRPKHAALEVEGMAAGFEKGHVQQTARADDDSARVLHQTTAAKAGNQS